jgi:hypothetical protein
LQKQGRPATGAAAALLFLLMSLIAAWSATALVLAINPAQAIRAE